MIDDYLALIPAAGVGSRAQLSTAKQFLKIGEKTILEHAIDPFIKDENCKKICVVTNEEDDLWPSLSISNQEKIISCYGIFLVIFATFSIGKSLPQRIISES